jgi:hypothetical protein
MGVWTGAAGSTGARWVAVGVLGGVSAPGLLNALCRLCARLLIGTILCCPAVVVGIRRKTKDAENGISTCVGQRGAKHLRPGING